ncbi:MAG: HAMP domain-containing sensor histidine kinase, partial [Fulvivirga sp.]|nr:HAMP domain-containing sensor histidine kinase [Fulvivirga sp.]
IGFVLIGLLIIWIAARIYTYRSRVKQRKLKLIIADRTHEVLKQKNEIANKNKKLRQSQEELQTLNLQLEKKVADRTKKIKITMEELKKINQDLNTFVYHASHDLRGPINRIQGLTSLGRLKTSSPENQKYYDLIDESAFSMQNLIAKLSHAHEIMQREIILEPVDMKDLVHNISRELAHLIKKDTQLLPEIDLKKTIKCDPFLIKIIFENILENALMFRKSPNRPHQVKVKITKENAHLVMITKDNGIGIKPELKDKIYDMFFVGSDRSKGRGLGLYIVSMAIEKLSGEINIDSVLYEYTVVTVKIPINH